MKFCDLNFANLHGFVKFTKITSRKNLYVYGTYIQCCGVCIVVCMV